MARTDPATRVFGDIRINVVVAGVVFIGALLYIVLVRKPREVPPVPVGDTPDGPDGEDTPKDTAPASSDADDDGPGNRDRVVAEPGDRST
jgi:hypothetical protein